MHQTAETPSPHELSLNDYLQASSQEDLFLTARSLHGAYPTIELHLGDPNIHGTITTVRTINPTNPSENDLHIAILHQPNGPTSIRNTSFANNPTAQATLLELRQQIAQLPFITTPQVEAWLSYYRQPGISGEERQPTSFAFFNKLDHQTYPHCFVVYTLPTQTLDCMLYVDRNSPLPSDLAKTLELIQLAWPQKNI